jgi:uncharacterized protein (DUF362 family)
MERFGDVTLAKIKDSADLRKILPSSLTGAETVIVKPNWFSPHPANFTDAHALGLLLEALDGKVIVIEGYTLEKHDGSVKFTVDGSEVDWKWIMENPDWGWAREEGRWEEIRRQDEGFLEEHGLGDLLREHGAEYVNVTEEIWAGRTVDPGEVKERVEGRYGPVAEKKLYGFMPEALKAHEGAPLVSLGKVKGIGGTFPSLTLKNLFGLIPDPLRSWWHGPGDARLGESIIDITRVYASYFPLYGVCEAFREATAMSPEGEVKVEWGRYDVVRDLGFAALGGNLVSLDAVLSGLMGVDPEKVSYLALGEEVFGRYDRSPVDEARAASSEWIPVRGKGFA